ncbi:MAG: zinc ribbon domain-containing protein [Thermoanaerobaculia bacterium]
MRLLIACPSCKRQFDATGRKMGHRFHCLCGQVLEVGQPESHEAAVVRCSSCGGPREEGSKTCRYCGADFTVHERDLHTICPQCLARVSDRARYCHHCAVPLLPEGLAGETTHYLCPGCGKSHQLDSRRLEAADISVLECPRCAGLWLGADTFDTLLKRSREKALPDGWNPERESPSLLPSPAPQSGPTYRPCPICAKLMHRQNFGRKSGVIIDSCRSHGIWFDAHELAGILRWVQQGGKLAAQRLAEEEAREAEKRAKSQKMSLPPDFGADYAEPGPGSLIDALRWLLGSYFS